MIKRGKRTNSIHLKECNKACYATLQSQRSAVRRLLAQLPSLQLTTRLPKPLHGPQPGFEHWLQMPVVRNKTQQFSFLSGSLLGCKMVTTYMMYSKDSLRGIPLRANPIWKDSIRDSISADSLQSPLIKGD